MENMFDKSVKLDIPCPGCGFKSSFSIKELEKNPTYVCPGCNQSVTIDANKFTQGLKDAEKQLKSFIKEFKI